MHIYIYIYIYIYIPARYTTQPYMAPRGWVRFRRRVCVCGLRSCSLNRYRSESLCGFIEQAVTTACAHISRATAACLFSLAADATSAQQSCSIKGCGGQRFSCHLCKLGYWAHGSKGCESRKIGRRGVQTPTRSIAARNAAVTTAVPTTPRKNHAAHYARTLME